MRKLVFGLVFTCVSAFAQSAPNAPDNAAADALKKRLEGLNLLNLQPLPKPGAQQIILNRPVASKVCAIPLLEVKPPGTADKIPRIQPRQPVRKGDTVQVPAPPCGPALFTNRK